MKLLVDRPLPGLAKWLRLCGLDAALLNFSAGKDLPLPVPGTYLVTRQARLRQRGREDLLVLAANDPAGQVAEICRRFKLSRRDLAPLTRCGDCNGLLAPVPREMVLRLVPEYVYHTQTKFFQCPGCGRIYWPGSHPARILARIEATLDGQTELREEAEPTDQA